MRRGDRPAAQRSYALALPRNLWQIRALLRPGGVPSGYVGSGRTGEVREEPIRAWCSLRTEAAGHQKRVGAAEGVRSTRQSAAAPPARLRVLLGAFDHFQRRGDTYHEKEAAPQVA